MTKWPKEGTFDVTMCEEMETLETDKKNYKTKSISKKKKRKREKEKEVIVLKRRKSLEIDRYIG